VGVAVAVAVGAGAVGMGVDDTGAAVAVGTGVGDGVARTGRTMFTVVVSLCDSPSSASTVYSPVKASEVLKVALNLFAHVSFPQAWRGHRHNISFLCHPTNRQCQFYCNQYLNKHYRL